MSPRSSSAQGVWLGAGNIPARRYSCWNCDAEVASNQGWQAMVVLGSYSGHLYVCPNCSCPTYFDAQKNQFPGAVLGDPVEHISVATVRELYDEARRATSAECYAAAVLCCRKILMHIGVDKGAPEGKNFLHYVDYLAQQGWVPPNGKAWVDHIRTKGNEANHEIVLMAAEDGKRLLKFTGMLLKFIYEFSAEANALAAPAKP